MQHMITNQEIARLRHAEVLREASRKHRVERPEPVQQRQRVRRPLVVALFRRLAPSA
jgi:hypothetical protein